MFQGLRSGSPLYILYKADPKIEIGEVSAVSNPAPMYPTTFPQNSFMPQNTVDITVKVAGETVTFQKVRAELNVADTNNGAVVIADNRDAMMSEIDNFRKVSLQALENVDRHQHVVDECGRMLEKLSPQLQAAAQQAQDIENLKKDMAGLQGDLTDIKGMLAKALGRSSKKED